MPTFQQDKRLLSLTTPLGANKLLVESFRGSESISELFDFEIEALATLATNVSPNDLIGKRVTVEIEVTDTGTKRAFNGMVASLESYGGDSDFNTYRIRMVPTMWLLTLNTQTRVFQNLTVVDIIKKVLGTYSITPADHTQASYTSLEYCTQYRETDLVFLSRLMEQQGIFFYFTHTASDHTLVISDASAQLSACPVKNSFRYAPNPEDHEGFYDQVIESFASRATLVTGQTDLWDYRFSQYALSNSNPKVSATKSALGANSHEFYDYADSASSYLKTDGADGNTGTLQSLLQNTDRDITDTQSSMAFGHSNASLLQSGFTFSLTNYPQATGNAKYLVTHVDHEVAQQPTYRSELSAQTSDPYRNTFQAQPAALTYRARKLIPKPRVQGVVTGKVVTPSGDDSFLDKYGRVCVQFWWDRQRKPHTTDNTLLRVAQQWAGSGWGTYFWPRIDDEVLIDFIDGDPDAPIVVGSLYNGVNMPKYDPAKEYTRSGILTRSSKNGAAANANELRFDDLKGSEQIFVNAEKDLDIHVENDWHTLVDAEQHLTVTKNQYHEIKGESHNKIVSDRVQEIGGDLHLVVKGKQLEAITGDKSEKISGNHLYDAEGAASANVAQALNQKVGTNYSLQVGQNQFNKAGTLYVIDAGQEVHIKAGTKVVIEAGMQGLCLSGPGGFVTIDASGVTIQGTMVKINSGGASLPGSPGNPDSPTAPTAPKSPTEPSWPGDDPRA